MRALGLLLTPFVVLALLFLCALVLARDLMRR
jgi:hypothetical protein